MYIKLQQIDSDVKIKYLLTVVADYTTTNFARWQLYDVTVNMIKSILTYIR